MCVQKKKAQDAGGGPLQVWRMGDVNRKKARKSRGGNSSEKSACCGKVTISGGTVSYGEQFVTRKKSGTNVWG